MSRAESPPRRPAVRRAATRAPRAADTRQSSAQVEANTRRLDASCQWTLLLLSAGVLVLSFVLSNRGQEQVIVPLVQLPLPPLCASRAMLGVDCPGCGMTRCFISVAHGNLPAALQFNAAGVLFFGVVAAQIPLRILQLWRLRRGRRSLDLGYGFWALWMVVIVMMVQWAVKLGERLWG